MHSFPFHVPKNSNNAAEYNQDGFNAYSRIMIHVP